MMRFLAIIISFSLWSCAYTHKDLKTVEASPEATPETDDPAQVEVEIAADPEASPAPDDM